LKPGSISVFKVKGKIYVFTDPAVNNHLFTVQNSITGQICPKNVERKKNKIRIRCDKIIGLFFLLMSSQYSLASILTFLWSIPNWQISACKKERDKKNDLYPEFLFLD
jgi:hypothetical protein